MSSSSHLSGAPPSTSQNAAPPFATVSHNAGSHGTNNTSSTSTRAIAANASSLTTAPRPRPNTSAGEQTLPTQQPPSVPLPPPPPPPPPLLPPFLLPSGDRGHRPNVLTKERRPSLNKKPSFTRRRGSTSNGSGGAGVGFFSLHHHHHQSSHSVGGAIGGEGGGGGGRTLGRGLRADVGRGERTGEAPDLRVLGAHSPSSSATDNNNSSSNDNRAASETTVTTPSRTRPPLPPDWATTTATAAASSRNDARSPRPAVPVNTSSGSSSSISPNPLGGVTALTTTTTTTPAIDTTLSSLPNYYATKMLNGNMAGPAGNGLGISFAGNGAGNTAQASEAATLHLHLQEVANKRISTLDYLRKAHEGRVYWFNTLRFDRTDLARMPYFDARRLGRRATNYLLLGLSLPAVVDLNSAHAVELLRSLNALLAEFDAYQQLHTESGTSSSAASSLSRAARLPHMFRRATPGSKVRRTSSAAAGSTDLGGMLDGGANGGGGGGGSGGGMNGGAGNGTGVVSASAGADGFGGSALTLVTSEVGGGSGGYSNGGGDPLSATAASASSATTAPSSAFATYYDHNADLLPGEEYALLLTPSLPFEPDFFETFATLCDVLIECYTRILGLVPTPRECSGLVAELFGKADARVRKLLVQAAVKEFEDHSRAGVKTEVANVGKVVLGGLM
ncbi:hypothetical protein SPI_01201 [Niveomyces insectorum RCEF 264]|uniref:Uncharacterized protein n=1 Tax=Niveomyces insectorum RCEF 264 TaxID=1081102 RepID=A0A167YS69_9HYPO|nr:hypothetical protein SPI_01201 [Niveomyces insectorum RCEF 264]